MVIKEKRMAWNFLLILYCQKYVKPANRIIYYGYFNLFYCMTCRKVMYWINVFNTAPIKRLVGLLPIGLPSVSPLPVGPLTVGHHPCTQTLHICDISVLVKTHLTYPTTLCPVKINWYSRPTFTVCHFVIITTT